MWKRTTRDGRRGNGTSGETFVRCYQYESCPTTDLLKKSRSERVHFEKKLRFKL